MMLALQLNEKSHPHEIARAIRAGVSVEEAAQLTGQHLATDDRDPKLYTDWCQIWLSACPRFSAFAYRNRRYVEPNNNFFVRGGSSECKVLARLSCIDVQRGRHRWDGTAQLCAVMIEIDGSIGWSSVYKEHDLDFRDAAPGLANRDAGYLAEHLQRKRYATSETSIDPKSYADCTFYWLKEQGLLDFRILRRQRAI